ncbi:nuclear transport factor 2 family protein [Mucilaginibacter auburnensis]|uniref:Putative lumazine-binding protein n=1 Tax=Mucilaginibacter auburnensis TaxID=1457233 RepID=A0A2H9VNF6_9SPHI|nr:nuclear transport factor 2 family protein [Mucilaginibacter auburnensis]PJJ79854.1 putative lumazine-binding protein [Mucilaginibacter auburnensis]
MKTLKTILFGLALVMATTIANANVNTTVSHYVSNALSKNDVVNAYTNALMHGNLQNLEAALAKDVEYNMYRGSQVYKLNKQALIDSFKASENVEQNCQYTTSILSDVDKTMVVRLDQQYEGYVRSSTITIKQQGNDWKITKIETRNN